MDFATSGLLATYKGSFKDYSRTGFWTMEALLTSSNFSRNFFGKENLSTYDKDLYKDNYYRVRTSQFEIKPSYQWKGRNGGSFLVGTTYESTKIVDTNDRLIDQQLTTTLNDSYDRTNYMGARIKYAFANYDNAYEPTTGLAFSFLYGTRFLTDDFEQNNHRPHEKIFPANKYITKSEKFFAFRAFYNTSCAFF